MPLSNSEALQRVLCCAGVGAERERRKCDNQLRTANRTFILRPPLLRELLSFAFSLVQWAAVT